MTSRQDERGAVMIIFALMLVASVLMIALVIDLGVLRADRKSNKSTADNATAAGLLALEDKLAGDGRPHPWRGVCAAYNYVRANNAELELLAEEWTDQQDTATLLTDPCNDTARLSTACVPGIRSTYARFHGTSPDGRITVDIKSGYQMPDPEFGEDSTRAGDNGDPAEQGCDHLAVVIRESQPRGFSAVIGGDNLSTRIRSVGRVTLGSGFDAPVSLLLLERRACRALRAESQNTRIIVEHSDDNGPLPGTDGIWPGLIHSDSDGSLCDTVAQPDAYVLEGRSTSAGEPTIVAKSANLPHPAVNAVLPSRISVFAKFFAGRPWHSPFPSTIGDTEPVASQRQGRRRVDDKYLANVTSFAAQASTMVNRTTPPDSTWTVFRGNTTGCQIDTGSLPTPVVVGQPNKLWFDCARLRITGGLTLETPDLEIVVTGELETSGVTPVDLRDVRKLWMKGRAGNNQNGATVGGPLLLNTGDTAGGPTTTCPVGSSGETPAGKTASVFVDKGAFDLRTGAVFRACAMNLLLKGDVPLPPLGTLPIPSCAAAYSAASTGTFKSGSGSLIAEWTAPNEIPAAQPTPAELAAHPFEDLALWTEASGASKINGGGGTSVRGVFFLPNANDFEIHGNGTGEMPASAQFIACRMFVSGSGTLKMVPDAFNFVLIPSFVGFELVR